MQESNVAERIVHPDYKARPKYNDIALIRLSTALHLNAHVRPACLCTDVALPWKLALATGFGRLAYGAIACTPNGSVYRYSLDRIPDTEPTSSELMKVQLSNVKKSICDETYKTMRAMHGGVISSQFCAGELAGKKDTCQGDSGGPLQVSYWRYYHAHFCNMCCVVIRSCWTSRTACTSWWESHRSGSSAGSRIHPAFTHGSLRMSTGLSRLFGPRYIMYNIIHTQ